jgi:hypothetical protein
MSLAGAAAMLAIMGAAYLWGAWDRSRDADRSQPRTDK